MASWIRCAALYTVVVGLWRGEAAAGQLDPPHRSAHYDHLTAPDEWGEEFCHVVNGVKIFAMGADYIPEDNLLSHALDPAVPAACWRTVSWPTSTPSGSGAALLPGRFLL